MILPEGKIYYSISEVCREVGLEPHVLRYWETEFPSLNPKKNRAGNRAYKKKDIELIKYIKNLLYDKQYTIQGAKKVLSQARDAFRESEGEGKPEFVARQEVSDRVSGLRESLSKIKQEIDDIINS
jgi:DNA-binding transcriptional MerR regulator